RENMFAKLFPGEEFSETKLKNMISVLSGLAEDFLVHNSLKLDPIFSQKILAKEYLERNNDKLFLSTIKSIENKTAEKPFIGVKGIEETNELLRLKEKYYIRKNRFNESVPLRLQQSEYFSVSFIINFIKRLKDTVILPVFYNIPFSNVMIDSVHSNLDLEKMVAELREKKFPMLWVIEAYYSIYSAIRDHKLAESEANYQKSKSLLYENLDNLPREEKFYLFDALTVYCIMREPSDGKFSKECFEVYKKMLAGNIYSPAEKEPMMVTLFVNIMLWVIDISEYDWLETFMEQFSPKLPAEHREDITNFAFANLNLGRRSFEKALTYISKVRSDFLLYKLQVRNVKFKIYYELSMFDQAFSLVDSYRHYLSENDEIHQIFKDRAVDFI